MNWIWRIVDASSGLHWCGRQRASHSVRMHGPVVGVALATAVVAAAAELGVV
jgi:hypothetical protein